MLVVHIAMIVSRGLNLTVHKKPAPKRKSRPSEEDGKRLSKQVRTQAAHF